MSKATVRGIPETVFKIVICVGAAAMLIGCANYGPYNSEAAYENSSSGTTGSDGGPSLLLPTGTPTVVASASPSPTSGVPPYNFLVQGVGYDTVTETVSAGKVLKLTFTPGQQNQTVAGTGFEPIYSKLGVYITINNYQQETPMMDNGLAAPLQYSGVMDFSSELPTCGDGSDSTCRQQITITISHPNYDFDCYNYGEYCPWQWVLPTHPWNGTMAVQTDDTEAVQ